jgi:RNA polymerase sigma-70 factor (ECF subfamily)
VKSTLAELEELYREKYFGFRNALATITGDQQSAHDVLQEAFVQAIKKRKSFREEGSLAGWVWRIAFRLALRDKRRRRFLLDSDLDISLLDLSLPEPSFHPDLALAIRELPPRQRLFVFLRYFADLEYADIAEACDVSVGTVGAALTKAREALLGSLSDERALTDCVPTFDARDEK